MRMSSPRGSAKMANMDSDDMDCDTVLRLEAALQVAGVYHLLHKFMEEKVICMVLIIAWC